MRKFISLLLCLGILCSLLSVSASETMSQYSLLDGSVRLLGRGEILSDGNRTFNWPNSGFEFKFSGTRAEVMAYVSGTVYFNIQIDGGIPQRVKISSGKQVLCTGLSEGEHTIRFVRATEGHHGVVKMRYLYADAAPSATQALPKRIEFIGDSYTTGYANVNDGDASYTANDTDNWYSYASYVARMLDDYNVTTGEYDENLAADYNIIAHQGKGLYVNGYDPNEPFGYTLTKQFELEDIYLNWDSRGGNMSTGKEWNHLKYQPQLVVIWLGTNDKAGAKYAVEAGVEDVPAAFENAYVEFIERIRSVYPESTLLCMTRPNNDCYGEEVKSAVERTGGAFEKVYFLELTSFSGTSMGHPSKEEAKVIAEQIVEKIYEIDEKADIWNVSDNGSDTIKISADYNTEKVYVYGKSDAKNASVGVMALKTGVLPGDITKNDVSNQIKFIGQTKTDPNGDYSVIFSADKLEGGYTFFISRKDGAEVQNGTTFEFSGYLPNITVKDGNNIIKDFDDISGTELNITIDGFDIKEPGFRGSVIVSQYEGDVLKTAKIIDASNDTTVYGTEITDTITLERGVNKIRIMYINSLTIEPIANKTEIR